MANKGFGAEKINLIGGGTPTVSSPTDLNLTADNVAISTNASIGGNLNITGGIQAQSGIITAGGFYGPSYVKESTDDNVYYDIPFLDSTGSGNSYKYLQIDYGQLQFNASDNTLRLYGGMNATGGFAIGIQSGGQNIVNQSTQYLEGINFAGVGNSISYNTTTRYVTVEIAGGSGGAGVGTDTSINTTGIITAAAFNSPYYNSGVPYIGVGAGATQIEFQAANVAITTDMTVGGAINAAGAVFSGIATGTFVGDGSGLTGLVAAGSGVQIRDDGSLVGIAQTIDFGTDLDVSNISAGIVTVSNSLNISGIDTAGVSVFNHIDAAGIVTALSFDSDGVGSPTINSGIHSTLSINSPTVAISTDMTVGGNLTVTGTINGSNLGGTLQPDGINMMQNKQIIFYSDASSTAFADLNSRIYGTSTGQTIWSEIATGSGTGIRVCASEFLVAPKTNYGFLARFTPGREVQLGWGGHVGDGTEHKTKFQTSGIGVSIMYDYQTYGHLDTRDIQATGIVTAQQFVGDGSGLTGVIASGSGIVVKDGGTLVGTAATVDFGTNLSVSAVSAGVVTVTASGSGGGGNTAGIDTTGVSQFNHINAVGIITANAFASNAGSASSIISPGTLTIEAPLVAFSTAVSIGSTLSLFGGDLNIFKNASTGNVVIQESGGANLNINANDLSLKDYLGQEDKAKFISNGAVELYYNNVKKLETSVLGVTVAGNVSATQFVGDGSGLTGVVASGTGIVIQEEGSSVGTAGTINFVGSGVTATLSNGIATVEITATGGGGGGTTQNLFETIAVSGQSNVVADSATDTLTLIAGTNMTISTNASGDSITFNSSGGGGGGGTSGIISWDATSSTLENVDTVNLSTDSFRGAEYHIHVEHSQGIQSQKVLIMQDGTSAYANEFAIMHDNNLLVSIGASVSGGNFYLSATPESGVTGVTTLRYLKTIIN